MNAQAMVVSSTEPGRSDQELRGAGRPAGRSSEPRPTGNRQAPRSPTLGAAALRLGLLAIWAAAGARAQSPLLPVLHPDTAGMEAAVRSQIEEELRPLRAAGAAASADAFGACGRVYARYQLNEPALACFENAARLAPTDWRWHYYLGVLLQARGDFAPAAERFARTLELQPGDLPSLLRLGEIQLQQGALDRARSSFEAALPIAGGVASAHHGLGRIALAGGDAAGAIAHFEAALARQPGASLVRYSLAMAYRQAGRPDDARRALSAYGGRAPRHPDPLMDQLAAGGVGSQQWVERGTSALLEKRFPAAAAAFKQALEIRPADAATWANYGVALEGLGDAEGAERAYRRGLEADADNGRAQYNLGTLLARQGDPVRALPHLEAAARLSPDSAAAAFNLARILAQSGQHQRALPAYDRVLQLSPQDLEARYHRALTLAALDRHHEAAAALQGVVAAAPDQAAPRLAAARALLNAGREREARSALEEGAARLPGNADLALLLVRVLGTAASAEARDGQRAWELAQLTILAGADREEALAIALGERARHAEAATHLRRALELSGPEDPARSRRSQCLAALESGHPCRSTAGDW